MRLRNKPTDIRFFNYVRKTEGCWLWIGPKARRGYGCLYVDDRNQRAHRVSWLIHYGAIPDGLFICHRCDNPSCVNPGHLFLGTAQDNVRDCYQKGRQARGNGFKGGELHHATKLTNEQFATIYRRRNAGEKRTVLASEFGISLATVTRIAQKHQWANYSRV